ncbi:MAG: DUF2970 domain-containing protein [Gammaproteobacteria bacterium]|jgi:hypothetical protein|nr:DUF2970 domain-containing protein [Gammaproteobacteria bacterium]
MSDVPESKPTLWQVIKSVLGAFFGVQSSKVRERDFTKGNPWAYIIVGLIGVTLFVLMLVGIVKLVLSGVGKPG